MKSTGMMRVVPLAALLGAGLASAPSFSQIEEVVVTAQKREQSANDIGITMNAFTATQLDDYGVLAAKDLEGLVPGLTVTNDQPSGVPVFTIRGVGFQTFTAGASSTVGLYIDETNIPYSVMIGQTLFDIERVEVLKGPQGDLYGRNTTAGQINFISKKPTDEFTAGIKASYGRYNTLDAEGYVSGPISDNVNGRLALQSITSDEGWQESLSRPGDNLGELKAYGVRGLLDIKLAESAQLLLNLHQYINKSENIAATPIVDFSGGIIGPIAVSSGDSKAADWSADHKPKNDNKSEGVTARLNWDLASDLSLISISAWDKFNRDDKYDTSGIPQQDADSTNNTDIKVFTQELRLEWTGLEDWYLLGGIFYSDDRVDENYLLENGGGVLGASLGLDGLSTRYQQDSDSIAVFGHAEWQFTDKLRLTIGARYTQENRKWTGCTYDSGDGTLAGLWNDTLTPYVLNPQGLDPGTLQAGDCGVYNDIHGSPGFDTFGVYSQKIDSSETQGKISLDYTITDGVLLYGTVSTGTKSGGFNGAAVQTHQGLIAYEPEDLTAYETGIKSLWLDSTLQVNAAAYYYDYSDKQQGTVAVTPVGNIVVAITNVPESEIYGAELDGLWQITDHLTWNLGVSYLHTEITKYQQVDPVNSVWPDVVTFDASGNDLDNSPEWQTNSTLTYVFNLTDSLDLSIAGDVIYKDDSTTVNQDIEGYTLYNARLGIGARDGSWSAMAWSRNITDEYYYQSESTSNCCIVRLNGMPRTYGVTVAYYY